ncbi:MAG: hypothetical protein ACP5MB_11030, partial [bacterium]
MKVNTKNRKKAIIGFKEMYGQQELVNKMNWIIAKGKLGLDALMLDIGRSLAETIMYIEREELSGEDYHPKPVKGCPPICFYVNPKNAIGKFAHSFNPAIHLRYKDF